MKSGIYSITNICSNKVYIGQSVDIKRRLRDHKYLLLKGKHNNDYLQKNFDKYGIECFKFEVIEKCPVEKLDERECFWISKKQSMKRKFGFNLDSGGTDGRIVSEETIAKITGEGNPMYGRKHSSEFVEMITLRNRGSSDKLSESDVEFIKMKILEGVSLKELAIKFNVTKSTVSKIVQGANWSWVRTDLNEKLMNYYSDINKQNKIDRKLKKHQLEKDEEERKQRNELIVKDFLSGVSKAETVKKYNVSKTTYTRIISPILNEKRKSTIRLVHELKNKGLMNKEIAEKLNLHRTTVTEYLKLEPK